jgi:Holliday junction resolvase RusA-like endonuclease
MTTVEFQVYGYPAPQGSKRPVRMRDGRTVLIESSKAVKPWRDAVVQACIDTGHHNLQMTGPLTVVIGFLLPRPKTHYRASGDLRDNAPTWHAKTPDLDKLVRSTFDALTTVGVIRDDANIAAVHATKQYADGSPGARITLTTLTEQE